MPKDTENLVWKPLAEPLKHPGRPGPRSTSRRNGPIKRTAGNYSNVTVSLVFVELVMCGNI